MLQKLEIVLNKYQKKAAAQINDKVRNYMEEIAWRYVPKLDWQNEKFERDYPAFWAACNKYWRRYTPYEFESLLKWGADNSKPPEAVYKAMFKKICQKSQ